jgi:CubicO group peptidase (beta-lactamase class C family)
VARIDAIGREAIERHSVPGLTIGVLRDGKVLINRGYGFADLENDVPARADSVFCIASVTKNFTAAAILQLVEHGTVSLDDDIGKFIPEFPHKNKGVTIRRLLNHTAGIHNVTAIAAYWAQVGEPIEPPKLIALFRDAPLDSNREPAMRTVIRATCCSVRSSRRLAARRTPNTFAVISLSQSV